MPAGPIIAAKTCSLQENLFAIHLFALVCDSVNLSSNAFKSFSDGVPNLGKPF